MSATNHHQKPSDKETEKWSRFVMVLDENVFSTVLHDVKPFTWYCFKILAFTRKGDGDESRCVFFLTEESGKIKCQRYVILHHKACKCKRWFVKLWVDYTIRIRGELAESQLKTKVGKQRINSVCKLNLSAERKPIPFLTSIVIVKCKENSFDLGGFRTPIPGLTSPVL